MSRYFEQLIDTTEIDSRIAGSGLPVGGKLKRSLDIVIALAVLVAIWPLFALIVVVMKVTDPGPVYYAHDRIGFKGRRFRCLKFRSMVVDSDKALEEHLSEDVEAAMEWQASQKLRQDPRVTALGRFLRVTSLDELPQLLNVVRGDMSIVGPRPIVAAESHRYGKALYVYAAARPGLTGLWQVSGRNDTGYHERVRLDVDYVQNWSFHRDMVVIFKTVHTVLLRRGSY
jgi:lipopolysaccharide/colanic/teichoic acid biosynthesis glycosyltransferase